LDIIIEGNLTNDEGMNDLLETIIHLKTVPNALLRISSDKENIKGRIGFAQGGYILGGCIDDTGELGYSAVKKLLLLKSGNYAVLDTDREHPQEINQTLWIKGQRILEIWPNLPESPDKLLDANGSLLSVMQSSPQTTIPKDQRDESISRVRFTAIRTDRRNPYRKRNIAILLSSTLLVLLLLLMVTMFGSRIMTPAPKSLINTQKGE
jgi:hypothetical protein